jgi:hypothetical protein
MSLPDRVPLDLIMVVIALAAAILFAFTNRPWYQTGILVVVACIWGTEVAILTSTLPDKQALYLRLHTPFAITTSVAVIALYVLRRMGPRT